MPKARGIINTLHILYQYHITILTTLFIPNISTTLQFDDRNTNPQHENIFSIYKKISLQLFVLFVQLNNVKSKAT